MPVKAPRYSYAVPGDYNAYCDRCGEKSKASELIFDDFFGLWVHPRHYDGMHPQERVEAKPDDQSVPWSQPEPADTFDGTAVLKEGDSKSTGPQYDIGIPEGTYNVAQVSLRTGAFDDQTTGYSQHPDSNDSNVVLVAKHSD